MTVSGAPAPVLITSHEKGINTYSLAQKATKEKPCSALSLQCGISIDNVVYSVMSPHENFLAVFRKDDNSCGPRLEYQVSVLEVDPLNNTLKNLRDGGSPGKTDFEKKFAVNADYFCSDPWLDESHLLLRNAVTKELTRYRVTSQGLEPCAVARYASSQKPFTFPGEVREYAAMTIDALTYAIAYNMPCNSYGGECDYHHEANVSVFYEDRRVDQLRVPMVHPGMKVTSSQSSSGFFKTFTFGGLTNEPYQNKKGRCPPRPTVVPPPWQEPTHFAYSKILVDVKGSNKEVESGEGVTIKYLGTDR